MTHQNLTGSFLDSMLRAIYRAPHERWLSRVTVGLGAFAPVLALANPSGGQVVAGSATIGSAGANGLVIDQSSQRAVINWQQFSIGANQYVQFVQPNSSSVVLNRVIGNNPSSIFGDIRANGQVFLINPNGILFAPGSSLDVSGLAASTLDISDSNFMAGNYVFSQDAGATDTGVVNQGMIRTKQGGYVVLAGDYAQNHGQIDARMGSVYLAAGNAATLTLDGQHLISYVVDGATLSRLAGVMNTGEITAMGGTVVMTADVANALTATAVNNSGLITAHSVRDHGGTIVLEAEGTGIYNNGKLDVSATQAGVAGGAVILHGDGDLDLSPSSQIEAGGDGAAGGFVDLSGHDLNIRGGFVNPGKGGKLLLDPSTISIESTGTTVAGNCSGCEGGVIHTNFIDAELNAGVDLTIIASSHIVIGSGNHNAGPATNITTTGNGKLSLLIGHTSFNTLAGTLHGISGGAYSNGTPKNEVFQPFSGGTISLSGLTINIKGGFVASASQGVVTLGNVTAANMTISGKTINTKNLTATTGNVIVNAFGSVASPGLIHVTGNVKSSNDQVLLNANSGSVHVTGNVSAPSNVELLAKGTGNGHNIQVGGTITGGSVLLSASGNGNGGGSINVGNVTATNFNVRIEAVNHSSGATNFKVTTGVLTAAKNVDISANGPIKGATVTTGAITAYTNTCASVDCNNGEVLIQATRGVVNVAGPILVTTSKANPGEVSIGGRNITFGNITAVGDTIEIQGRSSSSTLTAAVHQTAGTTLKARDINVDLNASYGGAITLANLTASSSKGPAEVAVTVETSHNKTNSITINGNITVSGKASNNSSTFVPGTVPAGATVLLHATGSSAQAHTIKVTGAINVTAHGGVININREIPNSPSCGECGTVHESGNAGMGEVFALASGAGGSVQLLGATTAKGTDAEIVVTAKTIKTGALTAQASGHTLTLSEHRNNSISNHVSFASTNNAGRAIVALSGSSGGAATTINTGNITVTGKGSASVQMAGNAITAGNIAVTATAAHGTRSVSGTGNDLRRVGQDGLNVQNPGLFGIQMDSGSYSAGRAAVFMADSISSHPATAQSIKVGSVSVAGVGEADINLRATVIQTGSLNATAAGGNMKGSFNSSNEGGTFHQTFTFKNEGEANVRLDTGSAANGAIIVAGSANASGPVAGVNMFAHTIKVTKGITVAGHGGQATVSGSQTGFSASTNKFQGPGPITAISLGGEGSNNAASINVGGTAKVTGPGLVGIAITGAKVTLGGLFASASNVETYKIVNTHNGTNDTFTVGSAAVLVFQESGGVLGQATVNGNVTINAPHGNVALGAQLNVSGQVAIAAAGNISDNISKVIADINEVSGATGGHGSGSGSSGGPHLPSSGVLPPSIKAAGISMIATAGSIDLTSATVATSGVTALYAGKDIILSGVTINTGTLAADAGSTIHNGGATGTITTKALALNAGKDINLSSTQISVGSGVLAPVASNAALTKMLADPAFAAIGAGDPVLLGGLATAGIAPAAAGPNAAFKAGGRVTLGALTLTGSYLYLQGNSISLLGPISTPTGAVVQLAAAGVTGSIDVEGTGASGANLNLNNTGFFSLFANGTTLVLGGAGQTGAVDLGNSGTFNIGSDNLVVYTTGAVTGLGNVISTGQVVSLSSLLNGLPPVTAGEIDPSTTTNNPTGNDKKHNEDETGNDTGGSGQPPITQDTGNSSVCH